MLIQIVILFKFQIWKFLLDYYLCCFAQSEAKKILFNVLQENSVDELKHMTKNAKSFMVMKKFDINISLYLFNIVKF